MEELNCLEGTVHSLIFQNAENGYTILRLVTAEGEVHTVVGCIPCAAPGEHLTVYGQWEQHPQHGEQFRAADVERRLPEDEEEIFSYLSSGVCQGVGAATARAIVARFGVQALEVLEREPEKLTCLKGITARKAKQIGDSFRRHMGLRRLMAFLAQYELPPVLAVGLRRQYGENALEAVRANPYLLSGELCGLPFSAADTIAMDLGFSEDSDCRVQAAVLFELAHNEQNGHVFLPREKLAYATVQLIHCPPDLAEKALDDLLDRREVVLERIANVDACYLRRLWEAETSASLRLRALLAAEPDQARSPDAVIDAIQREQGIIYDFQQRQAVDMAAHENVMLLTGGPGTGKTTVIRGIVLLFLRMGLKVVLAAPTGRATKRMSELTGLEAQTIHRLLGAAWNEAAREAVYAKSESDPLDADALIVDEMSMVDVCLFSALLRALRPGTRLVLVGDADQLPSVGPGNVFSDLLRSHQVSTVLLREVFRQAERSAIIRNARAVNLGQPPRFVNDQNDFFFLCRRSPDRVVSTVVELAKTRLPEKMGIPADQIQVLTPSRKGGSGTENLNRCLQAALNPPGPDKRERIWGERVFREGDRVMQTRNDYDVVWEKADGTAGAGIFNGDVGQIQEIDPSGEYLRICFDDRFAIYTADQLPEIDLAYAMTVHKSQGSEYRAVILAAAPAAPALMVRGVLYTALTRARELMIVVGDDAAVSAMAENDKRQKRYSGLKWRLTH